MCSHNLIKGIIAAVLVSVGLWVGVSGFLMQWMTSNIGYTAVSMEILVRYFVGLVLIGAGKHVMWMSCMMCAPRKTKAKPRRKR